MTGRLQDKVAIVTGAGRGNGRAIADVFAAEGARLLVVDMDAARAAAVAAALQSRGATASAFQADVSRRADNEAMAKAAIERFGRIDIACLNAGIYPPALIENLTEELWDKVFDVNLKSMFFGVQAVQPQMRQQKYGRIVLMSSISGPQVAMATLAHYAATKSGAVGFMRGAALELAPDGITINAVGPGNILTEGVRELQSDEEIAVNAKEIPLKRFGEPIEVGHAALFLASDEAAYITGQIIFVDGGQTLPEFHGSFM